MCKNKGKNENDSHPTKGAAHREIKTTDIFKGQKNIIKF